MSVIRNRASTRPAPRARVAAGASSPTRPCGPGARDGEQDVLGLPRSADGPRHTAAGPLERHEVIAGYEQGVAFMKDGVQRADEARTRSSCRGRGAEDPAPRARARAPRVAPGLRDVALAHNTPAALRDVGARQEVMKRVRHVGFIVMPLVGVVDRVAVHHEVLEREEAIDDITRRRAPPQINDAPPRGGLRRGLSSNKIGVVAGALRRRVEDARAPRPRSLIDVERIRSRWRRRRHAHVAAAVAHRARHVAVLLIDRQERAERRRGPHGARGAAGLRHRELAPGLEQRVQAVQNRRRREVRVLEHEPRARRAARVTGPSTHSKRGGSFPLAAARRSAASAARAFSTQPGSARASRQRAAARLRNRRRRAARSRRGGP